MTGVILHQEAPDFSPLSPVTKQTDSWERPLLGETTPLGHALPFKTVYCLSLGAFVVVFALLSLCKSNDLAL